MNRVYFPNINFLRAIAAILVLVYHVVELTNWSAFPNYGPFWAFRLGWLGVDLFFVISGFVIGLAAIKLYRDSSTEYRQTFMRRRLARIVPLYLFTAAIFLFLVEPGLLQEKFSRLFSHIAAHLGLVHNWFAKTHGSINGPNWSVAAEMQFYVLAIFLAPVLSRVKPWKILLWGFLGAWLFRAAVFYLMVERNDFTRMFIFSSQVPGMADEFAAGIFLARLYLDGTLHNWLTKWPRSPGMLHFYVAFLAIVALGVAMAIFFPKAKYWNNAYMVTFWRSGIALSFILIVALFTLLPDLTKNWFGKPLHYIGDISYGIYLWHLPVILSLKRVLPADNHLLLLNWSIVLTLTLAAMSWHFFEKPLMQRYR